ALPEPSRQRELGAHGSLYRRQRRARAGRGGRGESLGLLPAGHSPGRSKSIGLPRGCGQFPGFDENCPCTGRNDELGDPRAPDNLERLIAEIDQQHADFAAIIGIDRSRRVEDGDAVIAREPRPRPHLGFVILRNIECDAGWNQISAARFEHDFRAVRQGGEEIDPSRSWCLIGGQGQAFAMRQAFHSDSDSRRARVHRLVPPSMAASFATRRTATSCLLIKGKLSLHCFVKITTLLLSPPKTPASLTSLATIISQFLAVSLAYAFSSSFSLSAAKPTTRAGRSFESCPIAAKISGFSMSVRLGVCFVTFLIFARAVSATRQSATAATPMKISAGSAASASLNMSRAVST